MNKYMHTPMMIPRWQRIAATCVLLILCVPYLMAAITQLDLTTQVKGVLPTANGGTGTANAATGTAGSVVLSNSPSITTPTISSPNLTGALGSNLDLGSNSEATEVANAGTTGTTVNKLAKLTGAPSTAVITATTDTGGAIGVVIAGAGTTSNAVIAQAGIASCAFDAATVADDYVQISASVAGDCHDAGNTFPTSGQVLGRVLTTSGAAANNNLYLFGGEIKGAVTSAINFAFSEVPTGTINGVNTVFTLVNTPVTNSLQLFKNGQRMILGAGTDYTISTNTVTFAAGSVPKTGDALTADYRF